MRLMECKILGEINNQVCSECYEQQKENEEYRNALKIIIQPTRAMCVVNNAKYLSEAHGSIDD